VEYCYAMTESRRKLEQAIVGALQNNNVNDDSASEICQLLNHARLYKEALELLKEPIKKVKPLMQARALTLLGYMIKVGDIDLAIELATVRWMDRLIKVAKTKDDIVRDAVHQNIVDWVSRFGNESQFAEFGIAYNRLKAKGATMPSPNPDMMPVPKKPGAGSPSVSRGGPRGDSVKSSSASATKTPSRFTFSATTTPAQNASKVDQLMANVTADIRALQIGLQDPSRLNTQTIDNCKRHQHKIMLVLSTDLEESYTFQLIQLYDQLGEYLEIYDAINSAESGGVRATGPSQPRAAGAGASSSSSSSALPRQDSDDQEGNAEELEALKQRLAQCREEREAVEAQCVKLRAQVNDVRVKTSMAGEGHVAAQQQGLASMVRNTARASRRILATSRQQVSDMRQSCNEIKRKSSAYANMWNQEVEQLQSFANKAAKAEAKGYDTLKMLYINEMKMRKKLYNQIQEFRGNTRIFCRARPLNAAERKMGPDGAEAVDFPSATGDQILIKGGGQPKIFEVDGAFKPTDKNTKVFDLAGETVCSAVDGYNVCMFAYGNTGTGKTHTMVGDAKDPGIVQLTLDKIFETKKERAETENIEVTMSVLDIANEQIKDLFNPDRTGLVVNTSNERGCYIDDLTSLPVASTEDGQGKLARALQNRTKGDDHASRAALLVQFQISAEDTQSKTNTAGKLWLVDLPGAEKQDKMCINLGNCMEKMMAKLKSDQIPFKGSKLTHLLQDCLAGSAKQIFYVCISPSKAKGDETASCLAWAFRVRGVILGS